MIIYKWQKKQEEKKLKGEELVKKKRETVNKRNRRNVELGARRRRP